MKEVSIVGLDLAKRVFQVHAARSDGSVVLRRKLSRGQVVTFFVSIRRRPRMGLQHPVSGVWFGFLRSQLSRAFGDAPVSLSAH